MVGLSLRQERALAITPKVMSCFSIPSSIFLIYEIYGDHKTARGTTAVQRALVGMSIIDIMASTGWFLSTWAVPKGTFAYAAGNMTTCNFQGFLLQLAIGAPLYNSSLALFYFLMIKQRWTDEQLKYIERAVHVFIISFTVGTSILLLQLQQYNHIAAVCWVIGEPAGCGNSSYQPNPDVPCERGDWAWVWGLALFYGPLWLCVIGCTCSMLVIYLEVRKTHRRSMRYSSRVIGLEHNLTRSGSDSHRVAVQAMLYSLSFLITWMPSTLWSIAHWFNWGHYGLDIAAATAEPLQGFWNLLIYLKSKPKTVLKIRVSLARVLPCFFSRPNQFDLQMSFATSLKQGNRMSMSGNCSSIQLLDESNSKSPHRNTGSTEALDELKCFDHSLEEVEEEDDSYSEAKEEEETKDTFPETSDRSQELMISQEIMASIPEQVPQMPQMQVIDDGRRGGEPMELVASTIALIPDTQQDATVTSHDTSQDGLQQHVASALESAPKELYEPVESSPLEAASSVDSDNENEETSFQNEILTTDDSGSEASHPNDEPVNAPKPINAEIDYDT